MGWHEGDSAVYVYDRYDVWKVDFKGTDVPERVTNGRSMQDSYRYLKVDPDERFITGGQPLYFRIFNDSNKSSGIVSYVNRSTIDFITYGGGFSYNNFLKAKKMDAYLFTKETYTNSPDLYFVFGSKTDTTPGWHARGLPSIKLSSLNPQQKDYNWGSAELFKWRSYTGKESTGIVYKPEDFD